MFVPAQLAKAQAAGEDTTSIQAKLDDSLTKLATNIAIDVASDGLGSKGVV